MQIESIAISDVVAQSVRSGPEGSRVRQDQGLNKGKQTDPEILRGSDPQDTKVSPSEILENINRISRDGLYSIRFEKNDALDEFVVKIVDRETDEVIRQIPPDEILGAKVKMLEFKGNIVCSEW
jgi:flagellar protein FlaG